MSFINTHQLISYLTFYCKAKTVNSIHSPFIYQLMMECLENKKEFYAYSEIDRIRFQLSLDKREFEIHDLGAGSLTLKSSVRSISDILHTSVLSHKEGKFLYNLSRTLLPKLGLELGTSLGMSAMYLCLGSSELNLHTLEGDKTLSQIAQAICTKSGIKATLHSGNFDVLLPELLPKLGSLDLVYIDGNHNYTSTLNYHQLLKPYLSKDAVLVYDDIYWSAGMTKAWKEVLKDTDFQFSIDLFDKGLLIKHAEAKEKQHFTIIERRHKPWVRGIWG